MHKRFSLRQILIVTCMLVCVLPVATLAIWLHFGFKAQALEDAREKNQIISQNLAAPIHTYLQGASRSLTSLAAFLEAPENARSAANAAQRQQYFRTIALIREDGTLQQLTPATEPVREIGDTQLRAIALPLLAQGQRAISEVQRDPYTRESTVLFFEPVGRAMLVGLLDLQPVIALGRQVKFGNKGHAAITDQRGNIVLHPNAAWMQEIRNIADWPIIQSGMQGKTGVESFYSPFIKKDMIAGYASVPDFQWVIITPQPLDEFQARADALLRTTGWVALAGIALALILAALISGWISRPIAALAKAMQRLPSTGYQPDFEEMAKIAPSEFDTLQRRSKQMAREVRSAIHLRDRMNDELARMVDQATRKLQDANNKLAQQAMVDDLTKLHNRRALWQRISDLEREEETGYLPVQVLLFDLDNFKEVNDTLGHAAGDQVLTHVATILEQETRGGDFVVRYGGDEFLVVMHRCTPEIAQERARTIRNAVLERPLNIDGQQIYVELSVGVAESESKLSRPSFNELLKAADKAMYAAKARNKQRQVANL